jgi:NAD(P)-dependent dehydrogenase (short-subunit alcohol dehydrogenase family)
MKGIEEKSIIVTGGAQGLGEGIVRRLTDDGARVVIADLNGDKAEALAAELRSKTRTYLKIPDYCRSAINEE